ncbi:uncharacterized protein F4822DRAFT_188929 [Hypoxylon trugodes]|uniref:uncharacterized protein n=1 Tax=Hypoxylon trugodes TaxID=326681 RepID=UPI00219EF80C|nr:uncharacterized protein F4822DRAFT_188929 [Hypoxylon trugodes]KAI1391541.1 hypothetical protein F4822DRAFT_188929 [Hypoxylon trugodes]
MREHIHAWSTVHGLCLLQPHLLGIIIIIVIIVPSYPNSANSELFRSFANRFGLLQTHIRIFELTLSPEEIISTVALFAICAFSSTLGTLGMTR